MMRSLSLVITPYYAKGTLCINRGHLHGRRTSSPPTAVFPASIYNSIEIFGTPVLPNAREFAHTPVRGETPGVPHLTPHTGENRFQRKGHAVLMILRYAGGGVVAITALLAAMTMPGAIVAGVLIAVLLALTLLVLLNDKANKNLVRILESTNATPHHQQLKSKKK